MVRYLTVTALVALLVGLLLPVQSNAACSACKKLKKAEYVGIKKVKEYVRRTEEITILGSEAKAKRQGLARFKRCSGTQALRTSSASCRPVFAIRDEGIYFCPSQLKAFETDAAAQSNGYSAYTACGSRNQLPTPTPTPAVSPKPAVRSFSLEAGARESEVDAFSVEKLPDDSYRAYLAPSITSLDQDTIYFADSADGINFGARTAITGIIPDAEETFGNPAFMVLPGGDIMMIYEEIKHVSSAGVDVHNLMRAVSAGGTNFSNQPAHVVIAGGSLISSYFQPALFKIGPTALRMYYTSLSSIHSVDSSDEGATFGEDREISIIGRSDAYAPFPGQVSVVIDNNNLVLMFFTSPLSTDTSVQSVFLAESSDGQTFHVYDQPVLAATPGVTYHDPSAVVLPNGTIRVYLVERTGSPPSVTRVVRSLLED